MRKCYTARRVSPPFLMLCKAKGEFNFIPGRTQKVYIEYGRSPQCDPYYLHIAK